MKKYLFFAAVIILIFGCSREQKQSSEASASQEMLSDSTAISTDTVAKIIKTADMRFRVKDVQHTKVQLSAEVKALGGAIAEFNIQSYILEKNSVKESPDSLLEITSYRKDGIVIAKVPSEKLDDFINNIVKIAVFVDNQGMKMDDQSINYLANRLKIKNRMEALNSINSAKRRNGNVETSLYIKDDNVDKTIENMSIDNRVKFSTLTLSFYQDNTVSTLRVANDHLNDYRPGFFKRFWMNIVDGWSYFKEFILALANLWMLFVIGLVAFWIIRHFIKRNRLATVEATKNLMKPIE